MNAAEMIAHAEYLSQQYSDGRYRMVSTDSGCSRSVTIVGAYAFKAVHHTRYATQNRAEWDFYMMTTDTVRENLSKPLYISRNGNVIVMEALTPWSKLDRNYNELTKYENEIVSIVSRAHGFVIMDLHGGNWGMRQNGTVVLLDYGYVEWKARREAWETMSREERAAQGCMLVEPDYNRDQMRVLLRLAS